MVRLTMLLSLLACCLSTTGCFTYYNSTSDSFPFEKDLIWTTAYKVLDKRYEVKTSNKEEGTIETDWDYKLSPMYLGSYRDKVYLVIEKYEPKDEKDEEEKENERKYKDYLEGKENTDTKEDELKERYVVKISVERHQNRSLDNPNSKDEGFWFPDGFNLKEEQRIINFIYSQLAINRYLEDDDKETETEP